MKACKEQTMAARKILTIAISFLGDKRGVAAMEFAMIAPVLILLYLGGVETTTGLDVNKNLGRAASMVADLINQQKTITQAEISGIMDIGAATLLPYRRDTPQITITAINVDNAGNPKVAWSRQRVNGVDTTPFTAGSSVPANANLTNLLIPGTSMIRVQMSIAYVPLVAWTIESSVNTAAGSSVVGLAMEKTSYGRVRQGTSVNCTNCS